ncbi:MAG TPA: hypothetical protein VIL85_01400 [Thermomicrobiales bacterium]|jgi:hypothetical protein
MDRSTPVTDDGCLICGKGAAQVPLGVFSEYAGDGERHGARIWICEGCAQVEEYARSFVLQAREHYAMYSETDQRGERGPDQIYGYSYRIVSPVLRAQQGAGGMNRFHEWTLDI